MRASQLAQDVSRCPISRLAGHLRFLPLCHRQQFRTARPKPELAVKPECTRLDRLFILIAELVRINRETSRVCELMQKVEHFGIDPCGLAVAEGVKGVEADFHPLKQ